MKYSEEYKRIQRTFRILLKEHSAHPEKHEWFPMKLLEDEMLVGCACGTFFLIPSKARASRF